MLQRAASNAYSWWWASHIRTKQSKWMEQNLLDMEEKVHNVLKLLQEDGDSFAKKANMYYKSRPELINFVEETYRAYRALADRYDHISTELQNANNTIASVFPEQVQFSMDEEDEKSMRKVIAKKLPEIISKGNIPKVPKPPIDLKTVITTATKKFKSEKNVTKLSTTAKSGLSKQEALNEIDKLQKQVLSLQTEKEFVKSSYESSQARYWEIEKQIKEKQDRVFNLQDEYGEGMVIEDDEARNLMAQAALKSCQESLAQLQEKQESSVEEARIESTRIREVRKKLDSLNGELQTEKSSQDKSLVKNEVDNNTTEEKQRVEELRRQINEKLEAISTCLTMTEMAEKIDELVNKVISLETALSSQTALVKQLRSETDGLQTQIQTLEDDKASIIDGNNNNLQQKLKEMEEKFGEIQNLNQKVENEKRNFQSELVEVHCNLDHLSGKLPNIQQDEEPARNSSISTTIHLKQPEALPSLNQSASETRIEHVQTDEICRRTDSRRKEESVIDASGKNRNQENISPVAPKVDPCNLGSSSKELDVNATSRSLVVADDTRSKSESLKSSFKRSDADVAAKSGEEIAQILSLITRDNPGQNDEPNWHQLFMSGIEEMEKLVSTDDTTMLRNFADAKKKLNEMNEKNRDHLFQTTKQLNELKTSNALKDQEIISLHHKLNLMHKCFYETKEPMDLSTQSLDLSASDDHKISSTSDNSTQSCQISNDSGFDISNLLVQQTATTSEIEERLRMKIDELLEENLDFWLKFSTSFHQIQKFETGIQDLKSEVTKLEEKGKKLDESNSGKYSLKSEARPLYKHLREIQTELMVWSDKSAALKEELETRFSSLCNIQEEIIAGLKASAEDDDFSFTSYQAAKFQGEVLNMKQENNKVGDELQAALDNISSLQIEVETNLSKLNEEFKLSETKKQETPQLRNSENPNRVPLQSFIFGAKPKKQKQSIFSGMAPIMQKKYYALRAGTPL